MKKYKKNNNSVANFHAYKQDTVRQTTRWVENRTPAVAYNFVKCWLILKILLPADSEVNL